MTIKRYRVTIPGTVNNEVELLSANVCLSTDVDKLEARIEELETSIRESIYYLRVPDWDAHIELAQETLTDALQREGEYMTITELINHLKIAQEASGCNGETISSHSFPSKVDLYCPETEQYFTIKEVEHTHLPGCRCVDGVELVLEIDNG